MNDLLDRLCRDRRLDRSQWRALLECRHDLDREALFARMEGLLDETERGADLFIPGYPVPTYSFEQAQEEDEKKEEV